MSATTLTVVLGLSAAVIWGAGDFSGGMSARRLPVLPVIAIAHGFSMVCLLGLVWFFHQPAPTGMPFAWGVIAGVANGCALLAFYRALSLGNMGVTAALSGLLTAALPVLFSLMTIGAPLPRQQVGLVLAAVAIWLIGSQPKANPNNASLQQQRHQRQQWILSMVAGVGFGIFLITMKLANPSGLLWPLVTGKIGSLSIVLPGLLFVTVFHRRRSRPESHDAGHTYDAGHARDDETRAPLPAKQAMSSNLRLGMMLALLAGIFDTSGNFLFVLATRVGRLDIAAVLSSLYPASTILLAAWLLHERASKRQTLGMASAVLAVVLIVR
ncbi:MAG TPA: EamA family transporter [Acidobacteriaceae bacterium]|jgi:drug/metabolite transporter (DMT)-like permease|nr:EamA family transporter [Acidobacteriaceae bacterium]